MRSTPLLSYLRLRTRVSGFDVDHPVRSVLRTVLHCCCTCDSERGYFAAAFVFALSGFDVDHPVRSVLRTVLHCCCTCDSERGYFAAAFVFALSGFEVDHPVRSVLRTVLHCCCACDSERDFMAQPSVLHFLCLTSTIPSGVCWAQYSAVFVPAAPNFGCLPQPSVLHFLL